MNNNSRILSDGHKERIRQKIITGAQNYNLFLNEKKFKVICEDNSSYVVTFYGIDFQHLTGIKSDLNERFFYTNCVNGTIDNGNILTEQKYNWTTLKRKANRIEMLHNLLYTDSEKILLLKNMKSHTLTFPLAIKNEDEDICIGFINANNKARSLRNANSNADCDEMKKIMIIIAKGLQEERYNELVYLSHDAQCLQNLPSDEINFFL